jgi:hypothetical protein
MKLIVSFKFKALFFLVLSMYSISNFSSALSERDTRHRARRLKYDELEKQSEKLSDQKANAARRVFVGGWTTIGSTIGSLVGKPRFPRGPKGQNQSLVKRFKAFRARRAEYLKQNPAFARERVFYRGLFWAPLLFTWYNLKRFVHLNNEDAQLMKKRNKLYHKLMSD